VNVRLVILITFALSGCTSQFSLGPASWSAAPAIPGFTAVPLAGGGFIEEPNTPPAAAPDTPIETVIIGLEQAQKVRTLTRQLAR
jgi:hypothetical protein